VDAVWFGRGGYGSARMVEASLPRLGPRARDKSYLGYSDMGTLLAGLYKSGFTRLAHGPLCQDLVREGGEAAIVRALDWFAAEAPSSLEPSVDGSAPTAAFNITILSCLIGTPLQPDLSGHVLMLEEVSEHLYRIDRLLCHITSNPADPAGEGHPAGPLQPDPGQRPALRHRRGGHRPGVVRALGHRLAGPGRHRPRRGQQGGAVRDVAGAVAAVAGGGYGWRVRVFFGARVRRRPADGVNRV
jgi:hypothetical protein